MGLHATSVALLLKRGTTRDLRTLASVIRLLGYDPRPDADSIGQPWSGTGRARACRKKGWQGSSGSTRAHWRGGNEENVFQPENFASGSNWSWVSDRLRRRLCESPIRPSACRAGRRRGRAPLLPRRVDGPRQNYFIPLTNGRPDAVIPQRSEVPDPLVAFPAVGPREDHPATGALGAAVSPQHDAVAFVAMCIVEGLFSCNGTSVGRGERSRRMARPTSRARNSSPTGSN